MVSLRAQVERQRQAVQELDTTYGVPTLQGAWPWGAGAAVLLGGSGWLIRRRQPPPGQTDDVADEDDDPAGARGAADAPTQLSSAPSAQGMPQLPPLPDDPPVFPAEALHALQQQAAFFTSLGQGGEAVRLYEEYLAQGADPAPLAWLELMELHRQRGDGPAGARVARAFEERFGCLPPQAAVEDERAALEAEASLLADLQVLWPHPQVLEQLEAWLHAGRHDGAWLSLEASRELLWLHGLAQHLLQDASAVVASGVGLDQFQAADAAPQGLDIDLAALAHAHEQARVIRVSGDERGDEAANRSAWDPTPFDIATGFEHRYAGGGARG